MTNKTDEILKKNLDKFLDIEFIKKIYDIVYQETSGFIEICFPKHKNQKDKIHLLLEPRKKLNFFDIAKLSRKIKNEFDFSYSEDDDFIIITMKNLLNKDSELYEETLFLSER